MRTLLSGAAALLIFATATCCFGQGTAFTDEASFDASLSGNVCLESDYSTIGESLDEVFGPVAQPFGSFDFIDSGFPLLDFVPFPPFPAAGITGTEVDAILVPADQCLVINFDSSLGQLEGFGYGSFAFADDPLVAPEFTVFDTNNNVVFTQVLPIDEPINFFGWTNTDGVDVDRIEICAVVNFGITGGKATFIEDATTDCQSLLANLVSDVEALLPTGDATDDYLIEGALANLRVMQDPVFFANENQLSEYGSIFFLGANYATYSLDYVSTIDVQQQLLGIQDVLACLVEAELQSAIDRGGDQDFIDFAMYLEGCAQAFEDAGLFYEAVYFRKLAWAYARSS